MKNIFKQIMLICLVITSVVAIGLFAACDNNKNNDTTVTYTVLVEDDAHTPVKGVRVNWNKGGTRYDAVITGDDGKATMELAPDTYDITFVAASLPDGYTAPTGIKVTKDAPTVTATLEKQFRYVVNLVNEDGTPFYYEGVTIAICQLEGSCLTPSPLGEGGKWSYAGADPGDYKVQIQFPEEIEGLYIFEGSEVGDGHYYTGKNFSATETEMTITIKAVSSQITLDATGEHKVTVRSATEYATVNFKAAETGVYQISSDGNFDTRVEYSPNEHFFIRNAEDDDSGEGKNFRLGGIEFKAVGPTVTFHIYVKAGATFPATFNIKIVRTGDAEVVVERVPQVMEPEQIGATYSEGNGVFTDIDLSEVPALKKDASGIYHIGTVDGPVLVAKLKGAFRNNFGVLTSEFGAGFYMYLIDMTDAAVAWNYLSFLDDYAAKCNSDGVYPVNDEIKLMLERWATNYINEQTLGLSSLGTIANGNEWLIPCGYYDASVAPVEADVIVGEYISEEGYTLTVSKNGNYTITEKNMTGTNTIESGSWVKNSENNYTFSFEFIDETVTYAVTRDAQGKLTFTDSGETVYVFEVKTQS